VIHQNLNLTLQKMDCLQKIKHTETSTTEETTIKNHTEEYPTPTPMGIPIKTKVIKRIQSYEITNKVLGTGTYGKILMARNV
jgi:hypothetical protein